MGRRGCRLLLVAALAGGRAAAQSVAFAPAISLAPATPPYQVALGPWTAPPALDLLSGEPRLSPIHSLSALYPGGALAAVAPFPPPPFDPAGMPFGTCFAAGSWADGGAAGGDGLADLAWCDPPLVVYQASLGGFGAQPGLTRDLSPTGLAFAHLLDRAADVLVVGGRQWLEAVESPTDRAFQEPQRIMLGLPVSLIDPAPTLALQPLHLGSVARGTAPGSAGRLFHDLAWSRSGRPNLFVVWTAAAAAALDAANYPGQLLTFSGASEVHGAAAVDADGDGIPDLLAVVVSATGQGRLMAVHNPGDPPTPGNPLPLDVATAADVGAALGLVDPQRVEPLELDGAPAAAVFDRGAGFLHVVTASPSGGLLSWNTASSPVSQVLAGDLVGSAAADLVVAPADGSLQVFPGDLAPRVVWAPGSPPAGGDTATDMIFAVDASDPDGTVAVVELFLDGVPSALPPARAGTSYTFTVPAAALCSLGPSLRATVRATDDLGAWREVATTVSVTDQPALVLDAAGPTLPVVLLPGGTALSLVARATDGCGRPVVYGWSEQGLPPGAQASTASDAVSSTRSLAFPEASYPAIVAGPSLTATVEVTASAGTVSAARSLTLLFDASGLVEAAHVADRTALAPGELALLTTRLRSRIGVDLPLVLLDDRLAGLVPAGPVRVRGATLLDRTDDSGGTALALDAVRAGGAPVEIEMPVRRTEAPGGASRAQALAAASRAPLSASVEAEAPRAARPGLGCGAGGVSLVGLLALALYMKAMRRVPARTRSTSSSTPMRRQA